MPGLTYTEDEAETAPQGHVRFAGTDVDVVAYRINATDLCVLVNKGGQCVYRATLVGALDPKLKPLTTHNPFLEDNFIVHDLASAREAMERLEREGGTISRSHIRGVSYSVHKSK